MIYLHVDDFYPKHMVATASSMWRLLWDPGFRLLFFFAGPRLCQQSSLWDTRDHQSLLRSPNITWKRWGCSGLSQLHHFREQVTRQNQYTIPLVALGHVKFGVQPLTCRGVWKILRKNWFSWKFRIVSKSRVFETSCWLEAIIIFYHTLYIV